MRTTRQTAGTIVAACLAALVAQSGFAVPGTINGVLQSSLHATGSQVTWWTDAFLLPTAVLELTFGVLGDLFGRKRLLVGGAALMAAGLMLGSQAHSVHLLWVAQAVAGVGAAALLPGSLSAIAAVTPGKSARATGLTMWTLSLSAGTVVTPLGAGWIVEQAGYGWVFGAVGLLAVVSLVVSVIWARDSRSPEGRGLDLPGQVTFTIALFVILYGVIDAPIAGWRSPQVLASFGAGAAGLVAFLWTEHRSATPLIRLDLFRIPAFGGASLVGLLGMFAYLATAYSLSMKLTVIEQRSPLETGAWFAVYQGVPILGARLLSRALRQIPVGWVLSGGLTLMAAGSFIMAALPADVTLLAASPALIVFGVGLQLLLAGMAAASVNTLPPGLAGMGSATTNLMRNTGITLAPAIVTTVALSQAASSITRRLAHAGLSAAQQHAVAVTQARGGPFALLSTSFGASTSTVVGSADAALSHAFSVGQVMSGLFCVLTAVIAVVLVRPARPTKPALPADSGDNPRLPMPTGISDKSGGRQ